MDPFERLHQHRGVARRADLARTAAERCALAGAVLAGHLQDLGQGWVALPDAHPALVAARRVHGAISCVSAAVFYGLATLEPADRVHLAVPRARGLGRRPSRPAREATLHRESGWVTPANPLLPIVPIADALARALRCQRAEAAIVMVDSALNRGLVTVEEIDRLLNGPGSVRARLALGRCDGRSRSVTETRARLHLKAAGLAVRAGVGIPGVGEVDLVVEEGVVVECDGFAYHSGRREFQEDRRRDRELLARGFVVLRFTRDEVMTAVDLVVEDIRQAVARAAASRTR
ncbi:DUF559 domain-containing protein [Georgenia ruanii]|nr:DUF559 domain-containing protein [Georgenia ruanii]MPV88196.1 DUF559 domain-containing protein [Georgenia ruanii]